MLRARETQVFAGNETSHRKGEGIEFADLRQFAPGDPLKRVNWRASARRGDLWVNESHPERNTDVILFVDSFAEARLGGESTLDVAVRATAVLADAYASRRDRVGLIGYGGILRWLTPGTGAVQLHRIIDALLDTEVVLSYYWKEIDLIPRRVLPAKALVIALSPLLDQRSVGALVDLRARGFDVAVIEVLPHSLHAATQVSRRRSRLRHLAAAPGRPAPSPAQRRHRRHRVARGRIPASSPGGGAGIPTSRPAGARLITAGGSLVAFAAVAADADAMGGRLVGVTTALEGAALAFAAAALLLRWQILVPWAILAAGGGYLIGREGRAVVDGRAAVIGVLLLLGAELAIWSIEHDNRIRAERAVISRQIANLAGIAVVALAVNAALLGRPRYRAAAACSSRCSASAPRSARSPSSCGC